MEGNVNNGWARLALAVFLITALGGCSDRQRERRRLEEERANLQKQTQELQRTLDHHPIGSRFGTHPDTMRALDSQRQAEQRIREIDRKLLMQ